MRVCIVSLACRVHGIGGLQDHTTDLARGLYRLGHDVEVISAAHPGGVREETWEGIRWHFADCPPTWFGDRRWMAASWSEFLRASDPAPFDVVHGQGSGALGIVRGGGARWTPVVEMFHGNYLGLVKASLRRAVAGSGPGRLHEPRHVAWLTRRHFAHANWRCFRGCEAIVPSRQQLEDTCRSHRLDPTRVHVVPNGVDTALFAPRPRPAVRALLGLDAGFLFAVVGRLNREKGVHHAIEALAELRAEGVDATLVVVGDGEERSRLERLASERGAAGAVTFAGAQPREAVAAYLAASDAFLFPTERDEAAPLVLPQALACGLPVVASERGGIPEVIDRPGENGLLVPPGDRGALLDAMRRLHADAGLRARLGEGGLLRVHEAYTLERMVERTLEVYETAIAAHREAETNAGIELDAAASATRAGALLLPVLLDRACVHAVALSPHATHLVRLYNQLPR